VGAADAGPRTGLLLVHPGEPVRASKQAAGPYLEGLALSHLAPGKVPPPAAARRRASQFADEHATECARRLRKIGGSPQVEQGRRQFRDVVRLLKREGYALSAYHACLLTDPSIPEALGRARSDGVERLVTVPVFPACSAAGVMSVLDALDTALGDLEWSPERREAVDWHRHHAFYRLWGDAIRRRTAQLRIDLHAADTDLIFIVPGAPNRDREAAPRYLRYVDEIAGGVARELGTRRFTVAFDDVGPPQRKRLGPSLSEVAHGLEGARVVAAPIGHCLEGLQTLWRLDIEIAEQVAAREIDFHRVGVPWDAPEMSWILAEVAADLLRPEPILGHLNLRRCLCRGSATGFCLNSAS